AYRLVAQIAQVVWTGTHVQLTYSHGQLEAIGGELCRHERVQLVTPLEQVHVRVQTTRLFHGELIGSVQLVLVARGCLRSEEAERVEVRAADLHGFDDVVGGGMSQPQRP